MTLGQKIQVLRSAAGWSQEQMAEQLAVTRQTVSKWERDVSAPDVEILLVLSDLFEISLDELMRGEEAKQNRRVLDLEQLAERNRRNQRRTTLALVGAFSAILGGLALVFVSTLDSYLLRFQYMLYRYMTVGESVYQHERFTLPVVLSAGVFLIGLFLLLGLIWSRIRTERRCLRCSGDKTA